MSHHLPISPSSLRTALSPRYARMSMRMPRGRDLSASIAPASPHPHSHAYSISAIPSSSSSPLLNLYHRRSTITRQVRSATTVTSSTPSSRPPVFPANHAASSSTISGSSSIGKANDTPTMTEIQVTPPDIDAIRADEFFDDDLELIPQDQARIVVTPEAITQLAQITSREPPEVLQAGKLALRLSVDSGGCHGYQDTLSLTEERNVDDYVFQPLGVHSIPIVIDLTSLNLLKGSTLHYATELIGSSFRIQDNPQAKQGGACGCGVSWEAA